MLRERVVAAALACAALIASALLGAQSSSRLDAVLDENWRGSYDILVTAPGQDFDADQTTGLVDPNFVSTAGDDGIAMAQLDSVRALEGVEVAAPVGMVGLLRSTGLSPSLWVERPTAPRPVLARLTMTVVADRAEGPQALVRNTGYVTFDGIDPLGPELPVGEPIGFGPLAFDIGAHLPLGQLPEFGSTVLAVDPEAEAALVGEQGRVFAPLRRAPATRDLTGHAWSDLVDPEQHATAWSDLAEAEGAAEGVAAVPLIVSEGAGELQMRVEIDLAGSADSQRLWRAGAVDEEALRELVAATEFTRWREVDHDVSGLTSPFSTPDLTPMWPGSRLPEGEGRTAFSQPATTLTPVVVGRPAYEPADRAGRDGEPSFSVVPLGEVGADGLPIDPERAELYGTDLAVGLARAYRDLTPVDGAGFAGALPAPIGSFAPADLQDADADTAAYVPSGYAPAGAELVDGGDPGAAILPNLTGVDFLTAAPGAFTDLAGGAALRGATPIDAIRVRVGGVADYGAGGQQRVLDVARRIAALDLDVRVVAGSSPQPVLVEVPDLGTVRQEWTTLGAALRVDGALTRATALLTAGVVGVVGLGLAVTGLIGARGWRGEVAALDRIGWRPRRITRRLAARELPGIVAFGAVALGAATLTSVSAPAPLVAVPVIALLTAAGGLVVALSPLRRRLRPVGSDPAASAPRRRAHTVVETPAAVARRNVVHSRLPSALAVIGVGVLALVVGAFGAAVLEAFDTAGATRLADLTRSAVVGLTVLTAAIGLAAAVLLLVVGRRLERRQRRERAGVLIRVGLPPRLRVRMVRREDLLLAGAGLLASSVAALGVGLAAGSAWPPLFAIGAGVLASGPRLLIRDVEEDA